MGYRFYSCFRKVVRQHTGSMVADEGGLYILNQPASKRCLLLAKMPGAIERARQEVREARSHAPQAEYELMMQVDRAELA